MNTVFLPDAPGNEPVREYRPDSPETASLKAKLGEMASAIKCRYAAAGVVAWLKNSCGFPMVGGVCNHVIRRRSLCPDFARLTGGLWSLLVGFAFPEARK